MALLEELCRKSHCHDRRNSFVYLSILYFPMNVLPERIQTMILESMAIVSSGGANSYSVIPLISGKQVSVVLTFDLYILILSL